MDPDKCWGTIDHIIELLESGFKYLSTEQIGEEKVNKLLEDNLVNKDTLYDDQHLDNDEI
jgi:hypothetical protein